MKKAIPAILISLLLTCAAKSIRAAATLQVSVFISDISYFPTITYNSATAVLTFKDTALTQLLSKYKIYCFTKQFSSVQPYLNQFYCGVVYDSAFVNDLKNYTNVNGDTVFFPEYAFRAIPFCHPPFQTRIQTFEDKVRFFPNPAKDLCQVVAPVGTGKASVEVTDVSGRVIVKSVHDFDSGRPLSLTLSKYPEGTYFVQMSFTDGRRGVYRLLKRE